MSAIAWTVEFDWLSDGVYVDEAARMIALSVRRGREYGWSSSGRTPMRNGEATITLNNWDRRYDPGYNPTDVITDTFTGTGLITAHTPDVYPAGSAWANLAGDVPALASNKLAYDTGEAGTIAIDSGLTDVTVSVTVNMVTDNTSMKVLARVTDASNYLYLKIDYANSLISIIDRTAASETTLASAAATLAVGTDYTVVFTLRGSFLHGSINGYGVSITSVLHPTATKIGLGAVNTAAADVSTFDGLTVEPANLYGYLLPGRMMRIKATYNAITYNVFAGFVYDIQPSGYKDRICTITVYDGLYWLGMQNCTASTPGTIKVVAALYNLAFMSAWPVIGASAFPFILPLTLGALGLEDNGDTVLGTTTTGETILEAMENIAAAKGGTIYIDAEGSIGYKLRYPDEPQDFPILQSQVGDIQTKQRWEVIYNSIGVTGTAGAVQTQTNAASIAAYGKRNIDIAGNTRIADSADAANLAGHLILITPHVRDEINLNITHRPDLQFGLDLCDPVAFTSAYLGISDAFVVGGINHEWQAGQPCITTYYLEESIYSYSSVQFFPFTLPLTVGW